MAMNTWSGTVCTECAIIDANGEHYDETALEAYAAGMADYPAGSILTVDPDDGFMSSGPCMVCGTTTPGDRYGALID